MLYKMNGIRLGLANSECVEPLQHDLTPRQLPTPGLVPTEASHPSERRIIDVYSEFRKEVTEVEIEEIVEEIREVPRLAVIREEPDDEASRDGITARAKVPSWDEIMFGIKPEDK